MFEEGDRARSLLVGEDPGGGDAGMVVDGDMAELPSDAALVGVTGSVAGDAVADFPEARQLLDVDVDDLAGGGAFVTRPARLLRFERSTGSARGA